ncbi:MAG TPA: glycosyltransferase, partial [Gammaproteobacteria bacterium]|nr:glycosyltransferase [Gammaproteobacteria bacterium]
DGEIEKQISRLNLESKISFYSELAEMDIVNLYASAEIAVIPSLYEGFGFGAGEAMACGIPLISTHSGGLKEVVGKAAVKVMPKDSEALSIAIQELFSSSEKREHYKKVGRERIEKEFQWSRAAKKYVEIFEEEIDRFQYY